MSDQPQQQPSSPDAFAESDKLAKSIFVLLAIGAVAFVTAVCVFVLF